MEYRFAFRSQMASNLYVWFQKEQLPPESEWSIVFRFHYLASKVAQTTRTTTLLARKSGHFSPVYRHPIQDSGVRTYLNGLILESIFTAPVAVGLSFGSSDQQSSMNECSFGTLSLVSTHFASSTRSGLNTSPLGGALSTLSIISGNMEMELNRLLFCGFRG